MSRRRIATSTVAVGAGEAGGEGIEGVAAGDPTRVWPVARSSSATLLRSPGLHSPYSEPNSAHPQSPTWQVSARPTSAGSAAAWVLGDLLGCVAERCGQRAVDARSTLRPGGVGCARRVRTIVASQAPASISTDAGPCHARDRLTEQAARSRPHPEHRHEEHRRGGRRRPASRTTRSTGRTRVPSAARRGSPR